MDCFGVWLKDTAPLPTTLSSPERRTGGLNLLN